MNESNESVHTYKYVDYIPEGERSLDLVVYSDLMTLMTIGQIYDGREGPPLQR